MIKIDIKGEMSKKEADRYGIMLARGQMIRNVLTGVSLVIAALSLPAIIKLATSFWF